MIHLSCHFNTAIGKSELRDYVRQLDIDLRAYDQLGDAVTLGRIWADQLLVSDAHEQGEEILLICDQDSQGLCELYEAILDEQGEVRDDLSDEVTDHIIFAWRIILHPCLDDYRQGILDALGGLFSQSSILALWRDTSELSDKDLADLGFCKIAGKNLIYRHNALRTEFSNQHPRGVDVPMSFKPPSDAAEWLDGQVAKLAR